MFTVKGEQNASSNTAVHYPSFSFSSVRPSEIRIAYISNNLSSIIGLYCFKSIIRGQKHRDTSHLPKKKKFGWMYVKGNPRLQINTKMEVFILLIS